MEMKLIFEMAIIKTALYRKWSIVKDSDYKYIRLFNKYHIFIMEIDIPLPLYWYTLQLVLLPEFMWICSHKAKGI